MYNKMTRFSSKIFTLNSLFKIKLLLVLHELKHIIDQKIIVVENSRTYGQKFRSEKELFNIQNQFGRKWLQVFFWGGGQGKPSISKFQNVSGFHVNLKCLTWIAVKITGLNWCSYQYFTLHRLVFLNQPDKIPIVAVGDSRRFTQYQSRQNTILSALFHHKYHYLQLYNLRILVIKNIYLHQRNTKANLSSSISD